jgi:hypothetical protein
VDIAFRILGAGDQPSFTSGRVIMKNQVIGDCNHATRATSTLVKKMVVSAVVATMEFLDALGVGVAEAVNGLINVPYDSKGTSTGKKVD